MRKYFGIILSIYVIVFSILWIVLPKENFSENENRLLTKLNTPTIESLSNGKFAENFELYIQDHFAFRNVFLKLKTANELLLQKTENNNVYIADDNYLIEKTNKCDYSKLDRIAKTLNYFNAKTNIDSSILLAPTSISVNYDKLPKYAIPQGEQELIEYIYSKLKNYTTIYCLQTLQDANSKAQMYYRLDHHWTTLGAYTAYLEYAKTLNLSTTNIEDYIKETVSNSFFGTVYSKANVYNIPPDDIVIYTNPNVTYSVYYADNDTTKTSLYNKNYLEKKDKYAMFLDNNQSLVVIHNNINKSNKNLLIIKDSFANSFIPFVCENYNNTHVIDLRYYNADVSEYIASHNITNVLILYNIRTLQDDTYIFNLAT